METKYNARARKIHSLLCVGLDADFEKLPARFRLLSEPQFEFNKFIIEATHQYAAAYKPNAAFYEARGDQGIRDLKKTMDYLQSEHPSIYTILDAKRGDIGNTNEGYISFIFDWLGFDAVTLHPYMGKESLQPFLDRRDKTSIILCRTSNGGSGEFQDVLLDGKPLWLRVAQAVAHEWNVNGNCMLAVGATYPEEMKQIREVTGEMTFLVPGIGAQGGDARAVVEAGQTSDGFGLIINSSRGIIFAEDPTNAACELRDEINQYRVFS